MKRYRLSYLAEIVVSAENEEEAEHISDDRDAELMELINIEDITNFE